jgi:hypothetical protein
MKKLMNGLAIAAIASTALVGVASAQTTDTASSGNGGISSADANGGGVSIGNTGGGGNVGGASLIGGGNGGAINIAGGEFVTGNDIAAAVIAALGLLD